MPSLSLSERLWSRVDKSGECWLWTANRNSHGYGTFRYKYAYLSAHRVSYELAYGTIPDDLCVLHRCDVRHCVNPDHLFLGTKGDNAADMKAKGRAVTLRGSNHPNTILTEGQVLKIRQQYADGGTSHRLLGIEYGVHPMTIARIVRRQSWQHVS